MLAAAAAARAEHEVDYPRVTGELLGPRPTVSALLRALIRQVAPDTGRVEVNLRQARDAGGMLVVCAKPDDPTGEVAVLEAWTTS